MNNSSKISLTTATIVGMNAMIGSGIFTAPAAIAAYVGPAGILAYLFVIFAVWCISMSLSRMASYIPEEGSFYAYTKEWAGHTGGLIAGGLYIVGLIIAMGLLCQIAGFYLHSLIPAVTPTILGFIILLTLTVLNMFGATLSQAGQYVLIVCTVFPLLTTIALCFSKADMANLTPFAPYGFGNVLKATRVVIFGFFGFECAASLFNVVKNPQRNVPRALTYSILFVGVIYTLYIAGLILATPLELFTSPTVPISSILHHVFPENPWLINIIHMAMLSAVMGTIHSMIWSSAALTTSLLNKTKTVGKNITQALGNTGMVALMGIGIFTTFVSLNNIDMFFSLTAMCIVTAYALSMIPLLFMKKEWNSGRNIITIMGLATAGLILFFAVEGLVAELL